MAAKAGEFGEGLLKHRKVRSHNEFAMSVPFYCQPETPVGEGNAGHGIASIHQ